MQKHFLLIFLMAITTIVFAQQGIVAGGSSGGAISHSIGQVSYSYSGSASFSSQEGIQQPYEISEVVGVDDLLGHEVSVYPNPTTQHLTISIDDLDRDLQWTATLIDIGGQELSSERIVTDNHQIIVEYLPAGTYFVKISLTNQNFKTFKIIKK